jgi:hypothetical protein
MSMLSTRRQLAVLVAVGALLLSALSLAAQANASTIYACVKKKTGAARIVNQKVKCKKGESKLSWNTQGAAGKNGSNGANGSNGSNGIGSEGPAGQPQKAFKFSAGENASVSPTPIALFSADGINYTFVCQTEFIFPVGLIDAVGSPGTSYDSGVFGRPQGSETTSEDIKTEVNVRTIGATQEAIAYTGLTGQNKAGELEQYGMWTVTVEGPTSMTWIHLWMDTGASSGPTCKVHGTAITVPD